MSGAWGCGAAAAAGGAAARGRLLLCIALYVRKPTTSIPTPESTPGGGETVYALTKVDQEKLVLLWGKQTGIPTVALRYSCTYGPRQSLFNPYTGVIAIFCTRLLNGLQPVMYEDGGQTRDLCFVEDIARANLLVGTSDKLDGLPVNVGSGRATSVRDLAGIIADKLGVKIAPLARGEFRPGEIRSLISDISRARTIGYEPSVTIEQGIERYLAWISTQGTVDGLFLGGGGGVEGEGDCAGGEGVKLWKRKMAGCVRCSLTPITLTVALISAGYGHGSHIAAR